MASSNNNNNSGRYENGDDMPKHIPVDMGMAPRAHPYEQHHIHTRQDRPSHRQHSLSPEQLGVVGYVRDVAGFVKDTMHDIRETHQRRRSEDEEEHKRLIEQQQQPQQQSQRESPPPPAQQQLTSTPLANVVTGLFPGIAQSPPLQASSPPPACTHADALRQDLREQLQHTSSDKEHRLL
ncbi:uncharacterized protein BX664DRAFT_54099 [Halteromyces radiatus]|uniref:uncharacterized protein n=1 Tax=Halteromyces radiatus TaxID=101107 RepID=UPI002220D9B7|nr:uncharacterized protein BX664DRAFT_54099 [Halteromyces radiatus]KAI8096182.1 hypothetical protein BX664DRAFT_54099 [Halteromyces radiatus]